MTRETTYQFATVSQMVELSPVLERAHLVDRDQLNPEEKWLRFFDASKSTISTAHLVPLAFYGGFSRGIATGANDFFALSRERIDELGISPERCLPCITKSAQVATAVFTDDDYLRLERSGANAFCSMYRRPMLLCPNTSSTADDAYTNVISLGSPAWYKIERRDPAPLLRVFSREKFKVIQALAVRSISLFPRVLSEFVRLSLLRWAVLVLLV
jgi:adenine-specific DNA-methyltransferase